MQTLLEQAYANDGFKGKCCYRTIDRFVIGATFGYIVPTQDTQTVAFSQIKQLLTEKNWETAFYGAETFVRQQYQQQGIGTFLLSNMAKEPICRQTVFRTINPNQIKARERAWKTTATELFYDPVETKRIWYGVQTP